METLLLSDESFGRFSRSELDQNPEAIFDILTRQSLEHRYGNIGTPSGSIHTGSPTPNEAAFANDDEFESYVQQFPIDDNIAECFAFTSDSDSTTSTTKFVSGGKRPPITNKYLKLKAKLGWKSGSETSLLLDEEPKSSESKRSKKSGGVFSKRHKWRTPIKKSVLFCDQSGEDTADYVTDDVKQEISAEIHVPGVDAFGKVRNNSDSFSDSPFTSFSDTVSNKDETPEDTRRDISEIQLLRTARLPAVSVKLAESGQCHQHDYANIELMDDEPVDCFKEIISGDSVTLLKKIEGLSSGDVMKLRDTKSNTLLHRCVIRGDAAAVHRVMEKFPDMASDLNADNVTAMELAAETGKVECLKVTLERQPKRRVIGTSPINRLINISSTHGQAECLELLLTYVSRDQNGACLLTGDSRGNTAAHLVAKQGNVKCLQVLVAAGIDVSCENLMHQRPLHVAYQSRNSDCLEYLLLLDVCGQLLKYIRSGEGRSTRLAEQISGIRSVLDHVTTYIRRCKQLLRETRESLTDSRDGVMRTLATLHGDMGQFIQHTSLDTGAKRKDARDKLDELQGEIERLEDTFEFSPLEEVDGALTRLLTSVNDAMIDDSRESLNDDTEARMETITDEKLSTILCNLVKDFHKEMEAENWETGHIIGKYAGAASNGRDSSTQDNQYGHERTNKSHLPQSNTTKHTATHTKDIAQPKYINTPSPPWKNICGAEVSPKGITVGNSRNILGAEPSPNGITVGNSRNISGAEPSPNGNTAGNRRARLSKMHEELLMAQEDEDGKNDMDADDYDRTGIIEDTRQTTTGVMRTLTDISEGHSSVSEGSSAIGSFSIKNELTLDERMDLLIAGERAEEKHSSSDILSSESDTIVRASVNGRNERDTPSIYTNTLTSITSVTDTVSSPSQYFKYSSTDSYTDDVTSESASYWWDMLGDSKQHSGSKSQCRDYGAHVKLNLDNEDMTHGELRRDRLLTHLRSVQRTRYPSDELRERIRTCTGETIGGFDSHPPVVPISTIGGFDSHPPVVPISAEDKIVVNVNGALQARAVKPTPQPRGSKKGKHRLFSLEDAIDCREITHDKFLESYDRSRLPTAPPFVTTWEDTSFTDEEEMADGKPWYEMSDDDTSLVPSWRSDDGDTVGSRTPELL